MKRITIESPYAGDVVANERFAKAVCAYAVHEGHAPYASHLFFTQFLNDLVPADRKTGIESGFEWGRNGNEVWFCLEEGRHETLSMGMVKGLAHYKEYDLPCLLKIFRWKENRHVFPVSSEAL